MGMTVSSLTLGGGEPRRCGVCGNLGWVEPSVVSGDATCPTCGSLTWPRDRLRVLLPSARGRKGLASRLGARVGRVARSVARAVRKAARATVAKAEAPSPAGTVWDRWLDG
jgi:hypothetical protein